MIQKILKNVALIASAASSLAYAQSDIAYSQNNLPSQHMGKGYVWDNYPILFNADLLIGQIQGSPTNYGQRSGFLQNRIGDTFDFPNGTYVGFRFGLGIGLRNDVNVSIQWTRISGDKHEDRSFAQSTTTITTLLQFGSLPTNEAVKLTARQDQKYQTLDLLAQTAAWMLNSNIRFQPFGGIRYLEYTRDLDSKMIETAQDDTFSETNSHFRIRSTGVLIGTDLKYIFSNHFFFFSNLTAGILSGYHKRSYNQKIVAAGQVTFSGKRQERYRLSFDPMYELRLGFAFETLINKQWLLSIHIAYELASMIQTSAAAINPYGSLTIMSPAFPLRTNDVVKTQFFLVGFTVGF
ncbi:MAG: hypothetical protein K940chlam8_00853 [Chlamydiae bacterium]|nr:hypothetical protein [Chlamydiota bacterium]